MRPEVEEYLAKQAEKHRDKQQQNRAKTLIAAGLYTITDQEISEQEFYSSMSANTYSKKIDRKWHYFKKGEKIPLEVTDEEYQAIRRTMEEDHIEKDIEDEEDSEYVDRSWAARFCRGLAIFLWICGLFTSIVLSLKEVEVSGYYSSKKEVQFDFLTFLIWAGVYFVSGGLVMCLSEHFEKLHAILEELKESNRLIRKG